MPKLKAFTLIELLVVIFIMAFIYFMSVKLFVPNKIEIKDLYINLYPKGEFNLKRFNCKKYLYYDGNLKENNELIYHVKNGIGDSFLFVCPQKVYLFRPFDIKIFDSKEKAVESMSKYLNEGID